MGFLKKCDMLEKAAALANGAMLVLAARLATIKGAYLFPHEDSVNRPVPKVNNAHDRALIDSKLPHFVLYDCRHTWATRAVEAGVDLVTLAAMMGHTKIQMVLRYAHPTQEHQIKAMGKIEEYVREQRAALIEENSKAFSNSVQGLAGSE